MIQSQKKIQSVKEANSYSTNAACDEIALITWIVEATLKCHKGEIMVFWSF